MKGLLGTYLLVLATTVFAQQRVVGRVIDADSKEGLIGAHVYLLQNWRRGATTDLEGHFTLDLDVTDLQDSLIVSYVGFNEVLVPISPNMIIRLEPVEIEGETVVVTAKPLIAEEFKYMEIKKIDIYTNPAAKADPLLAVNALPSSTTTDESANISLRGSSPIETGIFLNNVPIYDGVRYSQLNGIGTFSIFSTTIIQDVTVFPGNPPLEFGNSTSGIISMQTDERVLGGNTNSLALSLANIGFSREQRLNDNQSLKLFTNWQPSGAIKQVNQEALDEIKSFTSNDLGLYWYGSNERLSWKVLSYSVTEGYQFNFEHPTFEGIFDQRKKRSFLATSVEKSIGKGSISLNNGLSASKGNYQYSNVAFEVQNRDLFLGANYLLIDSKFRLKSGVSYDYRNAAVDGNFHELFYAFGENHPTFELNESVDVKVLEAFGYFKYFITEKVAIGTGFRKNAPFEDQTNYLSFQGNAAYTDNNWTITLGAGRYHKMGLFENTGDPFEAMNTQQSIDIKRSESDLELALSLFNKNGEVNDSKYEASGAELFADYRLSPKLRVSGSVTLLDARSASNAEYAYDLNYFFRGNFSYTPGQQWTIESIFVARQGSNIFDVTNATLDDGLNAYMPSYAENSRRLPHYSNIGVSVSKVFAISDVLNIIAFASLNNVLDRENLRGYTYNFDYSDRTEDVFSKRTGYFGVVINF